MTVIADRSLKLRTSAGVAGIPIRLFRPEEKGGVWFCRFEIDWPEKQQAMDVGGLDAIQSLFLALQMIGSRIYASDEHKSGKLFLDAPGSGYGFPILTDQTALRSSSCAI